MPFHIYASMPPNQVRPVEKWNNPFQLWFYVVNFWCSFVPDGSMMTLDEAWTAFNDPIHGRNCSEHMQMTTILTQMEHPILFRPFLTLHPCRIAELLQCLPNSVNKVLSFLSTIGPAVHLKFDLKYAEILETKWFCWLFPKYPPMNCISFISMVEELNALTLLVCIERHFRKGYADTSSVMTYFDNSFIYILEKSETYVFTRISFTSSRSIYVVN